MKYAVAIIFALLLTIGAVSFGLHDPTLFIAGLALISPMLQFIPWQLAMPPEPEVRDYQGTGVGFIRDEDEDAEFVDSDFDPDEEEEDKKSKKR